MTPPPSDHTHTFRKFKSPLDTVQYADRPLVACDHWHVPCLKSPCRITHKPNLNLQDELKHGPTCLDKSTSMPMLCDPECHTHLQKARTRLQPADSKYQTSRTRLRAPDFRHQTSAIRLQVADIRHQTSVTRLHRAKHYANGGAYSKPADPTTPADNP